MKKKFVVSFVILSALLLFVFSGCSFASWSQGEFELKILQVYSQITNGSYNYKNIFNSFLNSNAYTTTKNDIPFDEYDKLFVGFNGARLNIYLTNDTVNGYINSNGQFIANVDLHVWVTSYDYDSRYSSFSLKSGFPISNLTYTANYNNYLITTPNFSGSNWFTIFFTNDIITNQYNYTIYGYNYTLSTPVYNGSTNVDVGQYYRLCRGFVGSYYYNDYQNIEYKILKNDSTEYVGTKNVYYTPDTNGEIVDIYFYIEPSMNNVGYKVVTYYNDEVVYQENAFNTLVINSGGSSSGDSGGGSVDLTETNNLIIGIGDIIKSGDKEIVNAIKSGDDMIAGLITDDSEVDQKLNDVYSSGDDVNDIINKLNFQHFENPYQNLIFGSIQNFCNLLYGSGDASISFRMHNGTIKTIYASEFVIPHSNEVFMFCSSFLIFGIIFVYFNNFRKNIDDLSSGEAKKVVENLDVDTNFIKM